jgi:hypothetical protein
MFEAPGAPAAGAEGSDGAEPSFSKDVLYWGGRLGCAITGQLTIGPVGRSPPI